jgi:hypothetical protein
VGLEIGTAEGTGVREGVTCAGDACRDGAGVESGTVLNTGIAEPRGNGVREDDAHFNVSESLRHKPKRTEHCNVTVWHHTRASSQ